MRGMKAKLVGILLLTAVCVAPAGFADTEDAPRGHNAARKLGRGLGNVLFGVVEVPNQYTKAQAEHGGGAGWTYGVPKGIARWFGRELVGIFEVVTFPIPSYKPIMKPEWPNEDFEP